MRKLTTRHYTAIDAGVPHYTFIEADHPEGLVRVWTGPGDLTQYPDESGANLFEIEDPVLWRGRGDVLEIRGLDFERDFVVTETEFLLSGVPTAAVQDLSLDVTGRLAAAYVGLVGKDKRIIDRLINITVLTLDRMELESNSATTTIKLVGTAGITTLDKANRQLISEAYQDARVTGARRDTGFSRMAELQDFESSKTWAPGEYRRAA